MTHTQILEGSYTLTFRHFVDTPKFDPDFEHLKLKIWFTETGFICSSPKNSVNIDTCKLIFPYSIAGGRCYACNFDEIKPCKFRQQKNAGNIQVHGNKAPASFKHALKTVYLSMCRAGKDFERYEKEHNKLKYSYINTTILGLLGHVKPTAVHNRTIYVLNVSKSGQYCSYKELISMKDIIRLYEYVVHMKQLESENEARLWYDEFNFTKSEFIDLFVNLIENDSK